MRAVLARISTAIGKYDRGGAIGPPNRIENDDRGGGICIGRLRFELRNLNAYPDKIQNDMVCSRFPNTIFLGIKSVQTRCIVKGEAQKSPFFCDFLGAFGFLRGAFSLGIPQENL